MIGPEFEHDCDQCIFLGFSEDLGDLYVCPQGGYPTAVIRDGDDGWRYSSSESTVSRFPAEVRPLAKALMRRWRKQYRYEQMAQRRARRKHERKLNKAWWDKISEEGFVESLLPDNN